MKNALRNTALIGLSVLYCFVTSLYSGVGNNAKAVTASSFNASDSYTAAVSAKCFKHTVQSENSFSIFNHARPVSLKNSHNDFPACIKTTGALVLTRFQQYHFYSQNLLTRVRQTDLIFPFHYFW
ncbi:MAG TPA: hypothetical protein VHL77_05205 [Ferruginibacter sp.]|nr:hypothetical protein [Ferruginibacter sp.]